MTYEKFAANPFQAIAQELNFKLNLAYKANLIS